MLFPFTCSDNFFSNPDEVLTRLLKIPFDHSVETQYYPGLRTKNLVYELNKDYIEKFNNKLLGEHLGQVDLGISRVFKGSKDIYHFYAKSFVFFNSINSTSKFD